jgi:hypothetical protein
MLILIVVAGLAAGVGAHHAPKVKKAERVVGCAVTLHLPQACK